MSGWTFENGQVRSPIGFVVMIWNLEFALGTSSAEVAGGDSKPPLLDRQRVGVMQGTLE
jgi:hypothetical protein